MKTVLRYVEVAAALFLAVPLLSSNAAAIWVWSSTGVWPRYGAPESWSSEPLSACPIFYQLVAAVIVLDFVVAPLAGLWSGGRIVYLLRQPMEDRRSRLILYAVTASLSVLFFTDPTGALFWFFD